MQAPSGNPWAVLERHPAIANLAALADALTCHTSWNAIGRLREELEKSMGQPIAELAVLVDAWA